LLFLNLNSLLNVYKLTFWFRFTYIYNRHGTEIHCITISTKALANGSRVQVWRDKGSQDFGLYMKHDIPKGYQIDTVKFRPYEDVLGLGHSMGFSSILIPGSGEPNFDSRVANPYETSKQRSKKEVKALLDKLAPAIMLDPSCIGMVRERQRKEKPIIKEVEQQMDMAVQEAKNV
jgi:U3 small nucleolar RNA-associated protein 7